MTRVYRVIFILFWLVKLIKTKVLKHTKLEEYFMKENLAEKIKSKYTKKSKILNLELKVGKVPITIFYIESLVDKKMFSDCVLSPLQKFITETKSVHIFLIRSLLISRLIGATLTNDFAP